MKAKVLKNIFIKVKKEEKISKVDKKAIITISKALLIIFVFSSFNLFSKIQLTNLARENFAVKKEIEKMEKDIDIIKSELLVLTNMSNMQRESEEKGFVYNENLGYIK